MFIDTNPIPVKKAVELIGMAGGPVRLPLDDLDEKKTAQLQTVLVACGIKAVRSTAKKTAPAKAPVSRKQSTGKGRR
jgi:4-hydroxy-tetrahydrodipicolinate synthase